MTTSTLTDSVLLIDFDNVVGPANVRPRLARRKVEALIAAAGPARRAAAFLSSSSPVNQELLDVLRDLGVDPHVVEPGTNAADIALLAYARELHTTGYAHFVLASRDADFHSLSELGTLDVLAWENQPVAGRLRDAANSVTLLPPHTGPTRPATGHGNTASEPRCRDDGPTPAADRRASWADVDRDVAAHLHKIGLEGDPRRIATGWDQADSRLVLLFLFGTVLAGTTPAGGVRHSGGTWAALSSVEQVLIVSVAGVAALVAAVAAARWTDALRRERRVAVLLWQAMRWAVRAQRTNLSHELGRVNLALNRAAVALERAPAFGARVKGCHDHAQARAIAGYLKHLLTQQTLGEPPATVATRLARDLAPMTAALLSGTWTAIVIPEYRLSAQQRRILAQATVSTWRCRTQSTLSTAMTWAALVVTLAKCTGTPLAWPDAIPAAGVALLIAPYVRRAGEQVTGQLIDRLLGR